MLGLELRVGGNEETRGWSRLLQHGAHHLIERIENEHQRLLRLVSGSGFGVRVLGFGFRVSGFGFRVSGLSEGLGFRV